MVKVTHSIHTSGCSVCIGCELLSMRAARSPELMSLWKRVCVGTPKHVQTADVVYQLFVGLVGKCELNAQVFTYNLFYQPPITCVGMLLVSNKALLPIRPFPWR